MRKYYYCSLLIIAVLSGCSQESTNQNQEEVTMASTEKVAGAQEEKVLRHVVLFKFKEGSSEADIKKIEDAFKGLPSKIDAILDFEWGTDVSVEGKADGYTHCFFVTFKDEEAREAYLPHPDHKAFGQVVGPHVDKVLVVDYWTQK